MTDQMITELTALTAVNKADLAVIVDDVAGSPITKKATVNNALATPVDYRDFDESASAPSNPAAGDLRIFALTDNKLYSVDSSGTVAAIGEGVLPHNVYGRITPASGDPQNIDGTAGATSLYFSPYKGNMARMWDGTRWKYLSFAELSIKLTETAQTGDTTNGSPSITNLTDTSHFVIGMIVTGTGIPANSVITVINSATQITMNNNATADGNDVADLVFKYPASKNYIFSLVITSGAIAIRRPLVYTTQSDLLSKISLRDGVRVTATDTAAVIVGTFTTSATAGQVDNTIDNRNIRNYYQPLPRGLGWLPLWLPISAFIPTNTGGCGSVQELDGQKVRSFSASADQSGVVALRFPSGWAGVLKFKVETLVNDANAGDFIFVISSENAAHGEVLGGAASVTLPAAAAGGAQYEHTLTAISGELAAGSDGDFINLVMARTPGHASDTYASPVYPLGVMVYYLMYSDGIEEV